MNQELHKRFPHELAGGAVGSDHVQGAVEGKQQGDSTDDHNLLHGSLTTEAWDTLVPDGG